MLPSTSASSFLRLQGGEGALQRLPVVVDPVNNLGAARRRGLEFLLEHPRHVEAELRAHVLAAFVNHCFFAVRPAQVVQEVEHFIAFFSTQMARIFVDQMRIIARACLPAVIVLVSEDALILGRALPAE